MTYVIDHEYYGVRSEFDSLDAAQSAIRACGGDFADVTLDECGRSIYDERGNIIGEIEDA